MKDGNGVDPFDGRGLAALAARVQQGDRSAEEALVRLFEPRVWTLLNARLRDREAARELLTDVLLAVLQAIRSHKLRDGERLAAFVAGTARNVLSNHRRKERRSPTCGALSLEAAPAASAPDAFEEAERREALSRELCRLEPTDRRILELTLEQGFRPAEIAKNLGLTGDVVRARKSRAIRKIVENVTAASQPARQELLIQRQPA
jgi:RNA polymerase sigma-70 factor (ECF subfamily)